MAEYKIPCRGMFQQKGDAGNVLSTCGYHGHGICPACTEIADLRRQVAVTEMERDHARKRWEEQSTPTPDRAEGGR